MKQLTQAIFNDCPNWVKSAAVDSDGECYWYSLSKCELRLQAEWWLYRHIDGATCDYVGEGFDTTDWQNSAIDRKGYRCPKCDYHHSPNQCRECECINCYSLII